MFNNLRSGSGTIDTIEVNLNPKRKFLYVDNDNFITPSTTAGISQIGYDDDIEIKNEATNPSIALYSSTGLEPKIDFIRFGRTFGTDSTNDWRIQNNDNLSILSGKNLTTTEKIKITDNDIELSSVDLLIPTTKKAKSEKYTGLTTSTNFDLGLSGDTGIINLYRDLTVATSRKITTPQLTFNGGTQSANKILLTDANRNVITSSYTDTDFPRLTANNTFTGINTFTNATPILTNKIDGTSNTANILNICNTTDTTSSISLNRDTTLNTNKNLTLQGTGKITTPNILVSGLNSSKLVKTDASDNLVSSLYDETTLPVSTPQQTALNLKANIDNPTFTTKITTPQILVSGLTANKIVLTDASKNLISSSYNDSDVVLLASNNTFTGINTFTNATPILTDKIDGLTNSSNNINIGNTSDTTSTIRLNRDTYIGTNLSNKYLRTDLISGLRNVSNIIVGESGDTGDVDFNRNIEIIDNTKGIFTNTLASRTATLPNNETLNIGYNDPTNYTGVINLNQNVIIPSTRNLQVNDIRGTATSGNTISIGQLSDTTSSILLNRNTTLGASKIFTIPSTGYIITPRIESVSNSSDLNIGTNQTSGNLILHNSSGSGVINANADIVLPSTKRIRVDRIVGTTPTTSHINIGYTDPAYVANIFLNQNTILDSTRNLQCSNIQSNTATGNLTISGNQTTASTTIGSATSTVNIGTTLTTGRLNLYNDKIHIGSGAGTTTQQSSTVAIGLNSGQTNQATYAIAIGETAQQTSTKTEASRQRAIGIGYQAQQTNYGSGIALGERAGNSNQGNQAIAIGSASGLTSQSDYAIGIGRLAGLTSQGDSAIAIGFGAGQTNQSANSICIGTSSSSTVGAGVSIGNLAQSSGSNCVLIGDRTSSTLPNSIVISAVGTLSAGAGSGCFIKPLRNSSQTFYAVYGSTTGELSYSVSSQKHKNNIKKLERNFDDVLKLRSVEYNFKRDNIKCIGLIAEQAYDINRDFCIFDSTLEPQAIDWFNIVLYQNEVIKENRKRIEDLENTEKKIEYDELENKYNDLENKYNNLSTELQKIKDLLIFKFGDVL